MQHSGESSTLAEKRMSWARAFLIACLGTIALLALAITKGRTVEMDLQHGKFAVGVSIKSGDER